MICNEPSPHQRQLWVSTGVHTKLKVTGAQAHHGATLPARMGEESSVSARLGPGGTVTRWEPVPSFPLRVLMKVVSFSVFTSLTGHNVRQNKAGKNIHI